MIHEIVNEFITPLEGLSFADLVVGIVKPMRISTETGDKIFPVVYNTTSDACLTGDYIDLLPNTSKRCVMYFEDKGTTFRNHGQDIDYTASVNFVCWFNYKLIDHDLYTDSLLVANVLKTIPERVTGLAYINRVSITPIRQLPKDVNVVFGAYTYNEAEVQFVTYPYDFFAIEYEIKFTLTKSCVPDISIDTACL
jgi:hypothetical protein